MKKRRFAISDIHGCLKTFKQLLETIGLEKSDELFLLGDYVDRGPNSISLVRYIQILISEGYDIICLKGNHELNLLEQYAVSTTVWKRLSGRGFEKKLPDPKGTWKGWRIEDLDFLANLKYYHETDGYILVHAGLNFDLQNPLKDTSAIMHIRNWYDKINFDWLGEKVIIHGHTYTNKISIEQMRDNVILNQVINIDCACAYNNKDESFLCALNLDDLSLTFQPNIEYL